jgi:centromeric protein E
MMGTDEEPGIIPLTINEIFKEVEQTKDREFLIRVGYIEIYNERIYDLLLENKQEINKIHETNGEVSVNQTEVLSSTAQNILDCYNEGSKERRVGETCMNERSSRSHTIFRIVIESHETGNTGVFQVSTLNLVDLAGSERVDQTKATGERLREGGHINKSLLALSKVIRELGELNDDKIKNLDGTKYINYRDSKLTRILSASLGGNAMTAIICTVTPCALEETYSTLT